LGNDDGLSVVEKTKNFIQNTDDLNLLKGFISKSVLVQNKPEIKVDVMNSI
jgi:hypothetical protein